MGSKTFDGIWFIAYSRDHAPPHVHGRYAGVQVIVDLLPNGKVRQSRRTRSVIPSNASHRDVRRILAMAADHAVELTDLWERTRGTTS